jgi:hypothetical protein
MAENERVYITVIGCEIGFGGTRGSGPRAPIASSSEQNDDLRLTGEGWLPYGLAETPIT